MENSISCVENSISWFENQFWNPLDKWETFCKRSYLIRGLEVVEIIPFPVWKFHFLFCKSILKPSEQIKNILWKKFFDQRSGSGRNYSISCLDNSFSCFENQFWDPWNKWETFCKISLLIRGLEVEEINSISCLDDSISCFEN